MISLFEREFARSSDLKDVHRVVCRRIHVHPVHLRSAEDGYVCPASVHAQCVVGHDLASVRQRVRSLRDPDQTYMSVSGSRATSVMLLLPPISMV